jgi:hypothetical protein
MSHSAQDVETSGEIRRPPCRKANSKFSGCALAGVSRAGYYRHWGASAPRQEETGVRYAIQHLALEHRHYGYRRIAVQLRREGFAVNHKRALRLMRRQTYIGILVGQVDLVIGLRPLDRRCGWSAAGLFAMYHAVPDRPKDARFPQFCQAQRARLRAPVCHQRSTKIGSPAPRFSRRLRREDHSPIGRGRLRRSG